MLRVLVALFLASPALALSPKDDHQKAGRAERRWWETAVVYQIYPRSFKDSDGDGVGDLNGITSKLEHLKDIGVGALWLSPIYPSPQVDFGYDISNFTDVDPQYGNLDDFEKLKNKAHELGIKVILDFVPNHSSDKHEWFAKSVKRLFPYTDYYVWHPGKPVDGKRVPPNNWLSNFRGSAWEFNEERGEYYLHEFAPQQPDLNYRCPELVEELKNTLRFWLDRGVDGFRVDTIPHLVEHADLPDEPLSNKTKDKDDYDYLSHIYTQNQPETYDMVQQWREVLDKYGNDKVMMLEVWSSIEDAMKYYGTPERPGAHFPFNFHLITDVNRTSGPKDFIKTIDTWMAEMNDFRKPNWVIGNHDKNRVASVTRYGAELVDGINMLSLMLPGTAMTYNGEEIGMEDAFIRWEETVDPQGINKGKEGYYAVSRDPERSPFQWDDTTSAGFSTNEKTWLPVNPNYWRLNLAAQKSAKHSHYHIYKALLKARKHPTIQSGSYKLEAQNDVLILTRELTGQDTFIVLINLGSKETDVSVDAKGRSMKVYTASMNSKLRPGDSLSSAMVNLVPKAGVVVVATAKAS